MLSVVLKIMVTILVTLSLYISLNFAVNILSTVYCSSASSHTRFLGKLCNVYIFFK